MSVNGKIHIIRDDSTIPKTVRGTGWTLCGWVRRKPQLTTSDKEATCLRCINSYRKNVLAQAAEAVEGFVETTTTPVDDLLAGVDTVKNVVVPREIRTTSSTGGQKGVKQARYSLIPVGPLEELAVLFGRGARKYDVHQWRQGYELSKGYDAMLRHQNAFWAGLDFDVCSNDPDGCQHVDSEGNPFEPPAPDTCYNHTGAHHLTAVAWHAFVMRELIQTHPEHDDRYIIKG